jgi:hypothetical protein
MEYLAKSALIDEDFPEKVFYLCSADSIKSLADKIIPSTAHFGLFLAMNSNDIDDDSVLQGARNLFSKGLASLCTWGPGCERLHDLFDDEADQINLELSGDDVIMTTWHADEPLEDALWFFARTAFVTGKFAKTCKDWIIAPISNPGWEHLIRSKFAQINTVTED